MTETLHDIQKKVRAAKDNRNDFGGYNYRNAEKILAELKAVLPAGWTVLGTDDIAERGPHLFLCHTVEIRDHDGKVVGQAQGWAMHPETKKGMDAAQITGACSTYAKKYALQNLLAIDDGSVDPDATNKHDDTSASFEEAACQHLSDSELENPILVAQALADAIRKKAVTYKKVEWLDRFMQARKPEMAFIAKHDKDCHDELRSEIVGHRETLKQGKAA